MAKERRLGRLDVAEDVVRIDRDVRIDGILGLGVLRGRVQTEDTCNYFREGGGTKRDSLRKEDGGKGQTQTVNLES